MARPGCTLACAQCDRAASQPLRYMRDLPETAERVGATGIPPGWAIIEAPENPGERGPRYVLVCGSVCAAAWDEEVNS